MLQKKVSDEKPLALLKLSKVYYKGERQIASVNIMKNAKTLSRNLHLFWTILLLCTAGAVLMTPQDAYAANVTKIEVATTPNSRGYYNPGDTIGFNVHFSGSVVVFGQPTFTVEMGSGTAVATYYSGSHSAKLYFHLKVPNIAKVNDTDGIKVKANSLSGNIRFGGGLLIPKANLSHDAVGPISEHKVDSISPSLSSLGISSSAGTDKTYTANDKIQVQVSFSENMWVTGTPQLTLTIGSSNKTANYKSGSSSANLVFEYTVAANDTDTDGISIAANQLSLNGGTLKDIGDNVPKNLNHSALGSQASHKVDTTAPTISSITLTSSAGADKTYKADDKIQVEVTFSEGVTVTGTPEVRLTIGATEKAADYKSGSGTTALVFEYTVANGDTDTDGISIGTNKLSLSGGTLKDTGGNAATLSHSALGSQASHKVDTTVPTVSSVAMSSDAGTDNAYKADEKVQVQVTFNEKVNVTGTPQLTLTIGSANRTANYKSGSGSPRLVFEYTITANDSDTDGISIAADQLTFNGSTIKDTPGHTATLSHSALGSQASHKVDTTAPTVSSLRISSYAGADKIYSEDDTIQATVTFDEKVKVGGSPQLTLTIGTTGKTATYTSGSGTPALVFEYTVANGDVDTDGVSIGAHQLSLSGGTIKDLPGNPATNLNHAALGSQASHKVDATAPTISSLAITSDAGTDNYYEKDDKIQVTVTFSEIVKVGGTPQVTLTIGGATRAADYMNGHNTTALVFEYTVVWGDEDTDGISIAANQLTFNGGTIKDDVGYAAVLTHDALPTQTLHRVDTSARTVSSLRITSTPNTNGYYTAGDTLQVTVTFSEAMTAKERVSGMPELTLTIGDAERTAEYTSGSGSVNLVFEYTVAAGDTDTDGISIARNQLSGGITDAKGNPTNLNHNALSAQVSHKVDTTPPTVATTDGITISSSAGLDNTYKADDKIQVHVTFSENVYVIGTPQLTLKIGSAEKTANYETGRGTTTLVFGYTVASGDTDTDGIEVEANQLANNGGSTIKDVAGNVATLTHTALSSQISHKVDTTAPTVATTNEISVTSTPNSGTTYRANEAIHITLTFTEIVKVTGTPQLTLTIGTSEKTADYESGGGSKNLVFAYTVVSDDADADGISIAANQLDRNSGTIKDIAGNPAASLTHAALPTQASHKVDGGIPTVSSLRISSDAGADKVYKIGDSVQVQVTFTEPVTVTGTPQVALKVGDTAVAVDYDPNASRNEHLVFAYTIAEYDEDTDGLSVAANQLAHNGGSTIQDASGNTAILTHPALPTQAYHKVDGIRPELKSPLQNKQGTDDESRAILFTSDAGADNTYGFGDTIQVQAAFTENVYVTGIPQLAFVMYSSPTFEKANYKSGSGTTHLVFEYTVAAGDEDSRGVVILAPDALGHQGTIKDAAGNLAYLANGNVEQGRETRKVDGNVPTLNGIRVLTTPETSNTYKKDRTIEVEVAFSEKIYVTGAPQLTLNIGTAKKAANYVYGDDTERLFFQYTVAEGDTDTDGISIDANQLSLNGATIKDSGSNATIKDSGSNAATLTHTALTTQQKVDGVSPHIVANGIAITSVPNGKDDTYRQGGLIEITVTFNEHVNLVDAGTTLSVKVGNQNKDFGLHSPRERTKELVFYTTVSTGDTDTDGISIDANQLSLNGGTLTDDIGNAAVLTHPALPADGNHKVDATQPQLNSVEITSTPNSRGYYKAGDTLQVHVWFSEEVTVDTLGGTPQLTLEIGAEHEAASYVSGSGTTSLTFEYTVVSGDTDTDGISIAANQITLNGGTIRDAVNNDLNLDHAGLSPQVAHKVDTTAPTVATATNGVTLISTAGADKTYEMGNKIQAQVTFSEKVYVTGLPQLTLKIGAENEAASYVSGSSTTHLVFEYTVVAGDVDTDGIALEADKLTLNGGTITDAADNGALLIHTARPAHPFHRVDAIVPTVIVNGIQITSTVQPYTVGETIQTTVTFSEKVKVTGTPQLTLRIGTKDRKANYISGSQTASLVFEYTAVTGDVDTDGIATEANQLALNGGTITDASGNSAILTHPALTTQPLHKVDARDPIVAVNGVRITSTAGTDNTYKAGDTVHVTVTFSESVTVNTQGGTPQLTLRVGGENKIAPYTRGSGTASLVFEYTIVSGDTDTDGISIERDKLARNGGTIKDSAGNNAHRDYPALPAQAAHKVDTTLPAIAANGVAITSTPSEGTYKTGNSIRTTVTFTESVYVTGTPQLVLKIGAADKTALYTTGSGTASLVFEYVVASGDTDTDGIEIAANQVTLPDQKTAITDAGRNPATLTHAALAPQAGHKVDSTTPGIVANGITLISNAGADNFYIAGDIIQVRVTFSKKVRVTGTPQLTLKIGTADKKADYTSGTGTKSLVFEYTIAPGNTDTDGMSIERDKLSRNGGTITDTINNAATLTHAPLPTQAAHKVEAVTPKVIANGVTITSTPTSGDTYRTDEKIQVRATFSETVRVTGIPTLMLTIGTENETALYTGGTGTTQLLFAYTVAKGDEDTDGISIAANQLRVPSPAAIKDNVGNPATLTHNAINTQAAHKVNANQTSPIPPDPTVTSVSLTSTGPYRVGSNIEVTVATSEAMTATGTPTLTVVVGGTDKTAGYHRGSGSAALVFRYTVVSGDADTNGVAVKVNSLALAGGTLNSSGGATLVLNHSGVADAGTAHIVDTTAPRIATNGIAMSSTPNNNTYTTGDTIEVQMTFSEGVNVTGTPQLTLKIGTENKAANYTGGTGTTSLIFGYTVVSGDTDDNGISIEQNQLSFNGGTIKDAAGNPATLTHTALTTQANHKVDTTPVQQLAQQSVQSPVVEGPSINSLVITSTGTPYGVGDTIEVQVTFSKLVKVSGTPQLTLRVGSSDRKANYTTGTGTTSLIFGYTVAMGDSDTDGIEIAANQLALNNGTITDAADNPATLTHPAVPTQGSQQMQQVAKGAFAAAGAFAAVQQSQGASHSTRHRVDGVSPSISSVKISSTPGSEDTYTVDETIQVQVSFSETVTVTGAPQLTLKIGTGYKSARWTNGNNTATLTFGYTVAAEDTDTDGISMDASQLSGTITDAAGNAADLTNTTLSTQAAHKVGTPPTDVPGASPVQQVDNALDPNPPELPDQSPQHREDTTTPQVSSLAFTSTGPYTLGDVIKITVTTTENVTVTGIPRIPIVMDEETKYASYVNGSGTAALVFEYTVVAGDSDTDGIEVPENALEHDNDSTIKSHYQTDLTFSHASLPADTKHSVDTAQPAIAADPKPIVDTVQSEMTADPNQSVDTSHPVITAVAFASDAPAVYTAGTTVEILLTFAETEVKVTPDPNGTVPSLSLLFGANADPDSQKTVVTANYKEARPGSTQLVFIYPVTDGHPDRYRRRADSSEQPQDTRGCRHHGCG